jgi:hypothetical protein
VTKKNGSSGSKRRRKTGTGHKQVPVAWRGRRALVDEGIAPLIEALWQADLETVNSCEENRPGNAWVQFLTAEDAATFLNIVAEYEEGVDVLYNRMHPRWRPLDGSELSAPDWEYDALPEDGGIVWDEDEGGDVDEWHTGRNDFFFSVSVRFPRADLPVVLGRLTRHNKARGGLPW